MPGEPTIAVFPEPGAWGPTNNLVAVGNHLRERGIRVVFVIEESFEGELEKRGFEEALMRMAPPPEHEEQVGEGWAEFIRVTAPEFRKPTIEQLETVTMPIWAELAEGAKYAHERLLEIWDDVRPDVIVTDNVTGFPAVSTAGVPWARMVSANPLEMDDPDIPPVFSGYPSDGRTGWDEFRAEYRRLHDPLIGDLSEFNQSKGAAPLPDGKFQYESPWLNMYLYPGVIDYPRATPLGDTWHRLDTSVRTGDPEFDVGEMVPGDGKVVYLSLGSLGCMDVGLMQRIIDLLGRTEQRAIVSMGPLHEQLKLGERMYGEQFLPQTSILPQCDLLITHGGNNTVAEAFNFGLPVIVTPLFWDQYDNAQRVHETGFGHRLASYTFEDEEFLGTVERLLADEQLAQRMAGISAELSAAPGRIKGADLIEQLVRTGEPVRQTGGPVPAA
jgi:UDP:flavonoid glycosyltransferase YjiC (YdhE family)